MTLDAEHLLYPRRAYGSDQDRYPWRPMPARPGATWADGSRLAVTVVVPLEFQRLNPAGKPFRHPGAMVTPYPDLRHYTTRDYGLRVGAFRILAALKSAGARATFPVSAALLDRVRPLVDAILDDGHEIAACGLEADRIHWSGLEPGEEARWVDRTRAAFDRAGVAPVTWLSPARQQSFETLDLIAGAGFDVCLDWEPDTAPVAMRTRAGEVVAVPLSNELEDRLLLVERRQSDQAWARQVADAADFLAEEARGHGPRSLAFALTPYVAGQPFRFGPLCELLGRTAGIEGCTFRPAAEVAELFRAAQEAS